MYNRTGKIYWQDLNFPPNLAYIIYHKTSAKVLCRAARTPIGRSRSRIGSVNAEASDPKVGGGSMGGIMPPPHEK